MPPEIPQIVHFLRDVSLFNSLTEIELEDLAALFGVADINPEETILLQSQKSPAFFIIFDGQTSAVRRLSESEFQVDVYVRGDFFGEDSLLNDSVEPASISTITPATILRLEKPQFIWLIQTFPSIKERLGRFTKTHQYLDELHFDWLNDDEVVYQVRRRHPANLIVMLAAPVLALFVGFVLLIIAIQNWEVVGLRNALLAGSALALGGGLGWFFWRWIDWKNDIYLLTSQRVVWNEKVIWMYESRIEAPLTTILSINVKTSYFGRLLGFGDVIVTTYTGKIILESIADPNQLASLITEYWQRSKQDMQRADVNELRQSIRSILGYEEGLPSQRIDVPHERSDDGADQFKELSNWDKYFGNIFKTRIENERVITYRKHWLILLRKTILPSLLGFALLVFILTFDIMYLLGDVNGEPPLEMTLYGVLFIIFILFPWWLYHYADWRNDIYQVSDRSIFDIERKPFGSESRKSASLENILSLEHSRPGFLGYILNVGFVIVNVGEAKFTFENVFQPARIQQDIFNRMNALQVTKQSEEYTREKERMLKMIEIYHTEAGSATYDV